MGGTGRMKDYRMRDYRMREYRMREYRMKDYRMREGEFVISLIYSRKLRGFASDSPHLPRHQLLKTQNYPDKCLKILEEFKNENHLAANSRVLRVHLLSPDIQDVTTEQTEVCNFLSAFSLP